MCLRFCHLLCYSRQEEERRRQNLEMMEARRHEDMLRRQQTHQQMKMADEDPFGNLVCDCSVFTCHSAYHKQRTARRLCVIFSVCWYIPAYWIIDLVTDAWLAGSSATVC